MVAASIEQINSVESTCWTFLSVIQIENWVTHTHKVASIVHGKVNDQSKIHIQDMEWLQNISPK